MASRRNAEIGVGHETCEHPRCSGRRRAGGICHLNASGHGDSGPVAEVVTLPPKRPAPAEPVATASGARPGERGHRPHTGGRAPSKQIPDAAPKAAAVPGDRASLARALQRELQRVGCYEGEVNGSWTTSTRMAMKAFTDRVNASLPIDAPDYILLSLVQRHEGRACGTNCPSGQLLSDEGRCVPSAVLAKAAAPKPAVEPREAKEADKPDKPAVASSSTWSPTAGAGSGRCGCRAGAGCAVAVHPWQRGAGGAEAGDGAGRVARGSRSPAVRRGQAKSRAGAGGSPRSAIVPRRRGRRRPAAPQGAQSQIPAAQDRPQVPAQHAPLVRRRALVRRLGWQKRPTGRVMDGSRLAQRRRADLTLYICDVDAPAPRLYLTEAAD